MFRILQPVRILDAIPEMLPMGRIWVCSSIRFNASGVVATPNTRFSGSFVTIPAIVKTSFGLKSIAKM